VGQADNWLKQKLKQFKLCALNRIEQFMCIPLLLEDDAYLWYARKEHPIDTFEEFCRLFLQQYSSSESTIMRIPADIGESAPVKVDIIPSHVSETKPVSIVHLQQTVADELIKKPSYFRGAKDDVQDWLGRIEQRFKMAK